MNKMYGRLVVFYYVAHLVSFTKAAQHLKTSKGYVSKEIAALERDLGSPLFHRNTRSLQLTVAGEAMFHHARQMVDAFEQAENTLSSMQNKVEGILRITAPSAYADYMLAPNLPAFFNLYPDIRLELNLTGKLLNLVEEKIDVAIRLTHEPPMDRIARRIGDYQMIVCASNQYLEQNKTPHSPKELSQHSCLIYSTERNYDKWPFVLQKKPITIGINSTLTANAASILLQAVLSGKGIARLPDYVVRKSLQEGLLTQLLKEHSPQPIPIYAIYHQSRIIPPKISAFIEFINQIHLCPEE